MAYLIILLIAIGLTAVMTANSVFFGGDAYTEGSTDAIASTYVNQAQQIQNSFTLYKARTGGDAANIQTLIDNDYMTSEPKTPAGTAWDVVTIDSSDYVGTYDLATNITVDVCDKINENGAEIVLCGALVGSDFTGETTAFAATTDWSAFDATTRSVGVVISR